MPVPAAEEAVGEWRASHDRWAAKGVPAHVTVQGPFLPREHIDETVLERLAVLLGHVAAQPFELSAVRYVPGVVYLAPASVQPFARINEVVAFEWPELPRYGGGLRSIGRYHLTIARTWSPRLSRRVVRRVRPFLPIAGRTEEALLFAVDAHERVELLARLPIGGHVTR